MLLNCFRVLLKCLLQHMWEENGTILKKKSCVILLFSPKGVAYTTQKAYASFTHYLISSDFPKITWDLSHKSFTSPISSTRVYFSPESGASGQWGLQKWRNDTEEKKHTQRNEQLTGWCGWLRFFSIFGQTLIQLTFLAFLQCNYLENRTMYITRNIWK